MSGELEGRTIQEELGRRLMGEADFEVISKCVEKVDFVSHLFETRMSHAEERIEALETKLNESIKEIHRLSSVSTALGESILYLTQESEKREGSEDE